MTVGELKKMLKPIADDVIVVIGEIGQEENVLEDICHDSSLIQVPIDDEMEDMFVLLPCHCDEIPDDGLPDLNMN
jgi:hypothetical protein